MVISFPLPINLETEHEFVELHRRLRKEHVGMHSGLAAAVQALTYEPKGLTESLDAFYGSRIGIRMLVDQHIAAQTPLPGFSGIVADHCSPVQIARDVIAQASPLWQQRLDGATLPEFHVEGDAAAVYRYIPQHIELILAEVLKNAVLNSLNSVAQKGKGATPPPVSVLVAGGPHGVCIKVSDIGGGMTRAEANALQSYYHAAGADATTIASPYDPVAGALDRRVRGALDFSDSFGLRIASLYAQYFGGALSLMPMEGHGVDTYVYMSCLTGASEVQ